jgi:hypothetical protein
MLDTRDVQQMLAIKDAPDLDDIARSAVADAEILKELLDGVVSKDDAYRYNCFRALLQISENEPLALYPEWDYFVSLLASPNAYHRSVALQLLARLTQVDSEKRFEAILDQYLAMLDDEKVMVARYLAQNAARIVKAKPSLQEQITARLLDVDRTHHAQSRKDLVKADIIQAFGAFFAESRDKEKILAFVEQQLESSSPKARQAAKAFLKEHPKSVF